MGKRALYTSRNSHPNATTEGTSGCGNPWGLTQAEGANTVAMDTSKSNTSSIKPVSALWVVGSYHFFLHHCADFRFRTESARSLTQRFHRRCGRSGNYVPLFPFYCWCTPPNARRRVGVPSLLVGTLTPTLLLEAQAGAAAFHGPLPKQELHDL